MNLAALYHRPDSEMAYLVKKDDFQIRLRTGTNEVENVILYYGDPYDVTINDKKKQIWEYQVQEMNLQAYNTFLKSNLEMAKNFYMMIDIFGVILRHI